MSEKDFTWPNRIQGHPGHDLIAAYLAVDIQHSPEWTHELLQKIEAVKTGQIPNWERVGNAYCLCLHPTHIDIESDFDETPTHTEKISLDDFAAAVAAWQVFIKQ